jgi:hypothetical protein
LEHKRRRKSEGGESRDEKMMMVKLIVEKGKENGNKNKKPTIIKHTNRKTKQNNGKTLGSRTIEFQS